MTEPTKPFLVWVEQVTGHTLAELPTRFHGYLHTAYATGVSVATAHEAHYRQRQLGYTEPTIRWRGSVTDLATDCAYLLTREQGEAFVAELQRFLLAKTDKFQGSQQEKKQ